MGDVFALDQQQSLDQGIRKKPAQVDERSWQGDRVCFNMSTENVDQVIAELFEPANFRGIVLCNK